MGWPGLGTAVSFHISVELSGPVTRDPFNEGVTKILPIGQECL